MLAAPGFHHLHLNSVDPDAAIDFSTQKHLSREKELVETFKGKGLKIYEPDVAAFRKHVQDQYLSSDLAKAWPAGMVDKINAM